jgi:hypothetical protein
MRVQPSHQPALRRIPPLRRPYTTSLGREIDVIGSPRTDAQLGHPRSEAAWPPASLTGVRPNEGRGSDRRRSTLADTTGWSSHLPTPRRAGSSCRTSLGRVRVHWSSARGEGVDVAERKGGVLAESARRDRDRVPGR